MPTPPQTTALWQYIDGILAQSSDFLQDNDAARNLAGEAITMMLGVTNALPQPGSSYQPLSVALSSTGLTLTLGGIGQAVICQQRICDTISQQTLTIPSNATGNPRVDLIAISYNQGQVNPTSREMEALNGSKTNVTIYQISETISAQYVTGTTSAPAVPSGYVGFATVTVPNGATTASAATVAYLFPTMAALFAAVDTAAVASLNGQTGAVVLVPGTGLAITVSAVGQLTITNSGITSLNGTAGPATLRAGLGMSIALGNPSTYLTAAITTTGTQAATPFSMSNISVGTVLDVDFGLTSFETVVVTAVTATTFTATFVKTHSVNATLVQPTIAISNSGVLSLGGQTGAIALNSGPGIGLTQPSSTSTLISNTGLTGLQVGGVTQSAASGQPLNLVAGANVTLTPGANGTVTISAASNTGPQGPQGAQGPIGPQGNQGPTGPAGPAGGIGTSYTVVQTNSTPTTLSVQLPFTLPSGNWNCVAVVRSASTTGSFSLTGSNASWSNSDTNIGGSVNLDFLQIVGTAIGGQQPKATCTMSGVVGGNVQSIQLTVSRIS
jgi:hypothetical protein